MGISEAEFARRATKEALVDMSGTVRDLASYSAYARVHGDSKLDAFEQKAAAKAAFDTQLNFAFEQVGAPIGVYRACAFRLGDAVLAKSVCHRIELHLVLWSSLTLRLQLFSTFLSFIFSSIAKRPRWVRMPTM